MKETVLFVCESVTLAHIARTLVLAQAINRPDLRLVLATSLNYPELSKRFPGEVTNLFSRSFAELQAIFRSGGVLYPATLLRKYVADEMALISRYSPRLVIGDFRPSLGVSAQVAGVPLVTITNAYWSPFALERSMPFPCLDSIRNLPIPTWLKRALVAIGRRASLSRIDTILAQQAEGLDTLRGAYGLARFPDYFTGFTYGDLTLYADSPAVIPTAPLPQKHQFLGPLTWSPPGELPHEVENLERFIFVSLGSSGDVSCLKQLLVALSSLGLPILVSSAGRKLPALPRNSQMYVCDYVPIELLKGRACLAVTNGGSPMSYLALKNGIPVLGIPSNMDQLLFMSYLSRQLIARSIRSDCLCNKSIVRAAQDLLAIHRSVPSVFSETLCSLEPQAVFARAISRFVPETSDSQKRQFA